MLIPWAILVIGGLFVFLILKFVRNIQIRGIGIVGLIFAYLSGIVLIRTGKISLFDFILSTVFVSIGLILFAINASGTNKE